MDVFTPNEQLNVNEWIEDIKAQGWCWYEDDKPMPHLWNMHTEATSSIGNMLIRAAKAGIDKNEVKLPLEKRIPMVSCKRFAPSKPKIITENGCNYVNTFKAHSLDAEENTFDFLDIEQEYLPEEPALQRRAVEPFVELLERLTSNPTDLEWLTCWIAHMLQKPEEKPSVHPLFRTQHGLGKNVLVEVAINKLLCRQTVTTSLKEIRGSHTESAASNLLVFVDESKAKGMNVYLELKSLLTTKELLVNPKHIRPYKQEVFSRYMFADNTEGRAFNIEQEDRRIYVMEYVVHERDQQETQEFISEFIEWFNVHWGLVHGWLINYDISAWSPHVCPLTEAKKEYLGMCLDPVDELIQHYRATGRQTMTELCWDRFVCAYESDESYSLQQLSRRCNFKYRLEAEGFKKRRVTGTNGQKVSGYFLGELKGREAYETLNRERGGSNELEEIVSESELVGHGYTV